MTTPTGLELVWAVSGGYEDPGEQKYQLGWVAEIPTFQNFNWVLQNLDKAKLSFAEKDVHPWQDRINYKDGARVVKGDVIYTCITEHNNLAGDNTQDPELDTSRSYWTNGTMFSSKPSPFSNLHSSDGVYIDEVNAKTNTTDADWEGNELTLSNKYSVIALNSTNSYHDNWVFGNVKGELVAVNVGEKVRADPAVKLAPSDDNNSYRIYHEGYRPTQEDVQNTIPKNPLDGFTYGRKDNSWVLVASSHVGSAPPPPTNGLGTVWYNLDDGTLYMDIDDGDSSQWVPASPPNAPNTYNPPAVSDGFLSVASSSINLSDQKVTSYQIWSSTQNRPLWAAGPLPTDPWVSSTGYIVVQPI